MSTVHPPRGGARAPIAPGVRVVRILRIGYGTDRWLVEGDGRELCQVWLLISASRHPLDMYEIRAPRALPDSCSPKLIERGTLDRRSLWWTVEVLRDVLEAIVRARIAPDAVNITIEVPPAV